MLNCCYSFDSINNGFNCLLALGTLLTGNDSYSTVVQVHNPKFNLQAIKVQKKARLKSLVFILEVLNPIDFVLVSKALTLN